MRKSILQGSEVFYHVPVLSEKIPRRFRKVLTVSEPSADTPKGDAPPASREQSEEAQEMDELEPDIEPGPSKRAEGQVLCVLPLLIPVLKSTYRQAQSGGCRPHPA